MWARPAVAAYLMITLTPLTVGISRGSALPLIRPNEAIALLVGATLALRGLVRLRTGWQTRFRVDRVEVAMLLMAVTNSVIPLLWMMVRAGADIQGRSPLLPRALETPRAVRHRPLQRDHRPADSPVPAALGGRGMHRRRAGHLAVTGQVRGGGVPRALLLHHEQRTNKRAAEHRGSSTLGLPGGNRRSHDLQPGDRERAVDPLPPPPAVPGGRRTAVCHGSALGR